MIEDEKQNLERVGNSNYYIVKGELGNIVAFYYIDNDDVIELEQLDPEETTRDVEYIEPLDALYVAGRYGHGGLLIRDGVLHRSEGKSFYPIDKADAASIGCPPGVACFFTGTGENMEALIFRKINRDEYKKANLWYSYQDKDTLLDMLKRLFKGEDFKPEHLR